VKKAARVLVEKYYPRLTYDFQTNKKIAEEVAIIPSKRLRNKIAGFATVCSLAQKPCRSHFICCGHEPFCTKIWDTFDGSHHKY
jgi:ribosomal protein S17E